MPNRFLNPPSLCPTFGWTHVVTSSGGRTVYISGQTSVDDQGHLVGKGDLHAQSVQVFENLKHALAAAGATFHHVVKSSLFVVGLKPEHVPILREVRSQYFDAQHPPASTLVGVEALVHPDWLLEIEVIAVVPE